MSCGYYSAVLLSEARPRLAELRQRHKKRLAEIHAG